MLINDQQSRLNATQVAAILRPTDIESVRSLLAGAVRSGKAVSIAGGRHSMGGQQFGRGMLLIDTEGLDRLLDLDEQRGLATFEAGARWPSVIAQLAAAQPTSSRPWSIREKQTGVDEVSLAGSLSANAHGRGLCNPPLIADIEAFDLLDASGALQHCSRTENPQLFALAIGGYGLFGVIVRVTLRLVRRFKIERVVEVIHVGDLLERMRQRIEDGFLFGDCQYSPNMQSADDHHPGVFACYRPVGDEREIVAEQKALSPADWAELYRLVRSNKPAPFERYAAYYLSTQGQVYWSDTSQLAGAFSGHREAVVPELGTEMISEVYLPWDRFKSFMIEARRDFRQHEIDMSYGTIRFIEADTESFLPWARARSVCVVSNFHVPCSAVGLARAKRDFRRLLDCAIRHGGTYYLAYHRWARRRQVLSCHPKLPQFLAEKRRFDPGELFQSDWYCHMRRVCAGA
jgi:FAD/FMN-containing dehydrogenase